MSNSRGNLVVLVTAPSSEEAKKLGHIVVKGKLAACATIIENVHSIFRWEANIASEEESLLILKTTESRFAELEERIKEIHSYAVPEIIALPIVLGSEGYLKWLTAETQK